MKTIWLLPLAALTTLGAIPEDANYKTLFNGKDLTNWTPKISGEPLGQDKDNAFTVKDGLLTVQYPKDAEWAGQFGHLFYKTPYTHYRLRLEYRFVGDQIKGGPGWAFRNNGIMIHCQDPKTMTLDQDFPVSAEVQLLGGAETGDRPTGNLCTPGTNVEIDGKLITQHCTNSTSPTYRGDQWVTIEVEVKAGGIVTHKVNNKEVFSYKNIQFDPNDADAKPLIKNPENLIIPSGYISLQSESHPTQFRNIQILDLQ